MASELAPAPIGLERSAFGLTTATAALLVVGASVRVNGAGLACPDWPLCFGRVIPPIDVQVGFEFGHRVLAGGVSLGFLALGVAAWRSGVRGFPLRVWAFGAVALLVQIVLGGLTVLHLLAEWTVASHLLTGNTFCASLLVLALSLRAARTGVGDAPPVTAGFRVASVAFAALVPVQLFLGGWVAGGHAGLVCGAFPGCYTAAGAWFPTFSGLVGLQVAHRATALVLWCGALALVAASGARMRRPAMLVLAAVTVQIGLGAANVLLRLPVEVTLLHTAGAATVFLSTTWMVFEGWRSPVAAASAPAAARVVSA